MPNFLTGDYLPLAAMAVVVALALAALRNASSDPSRESGLRGAIALFSGYVLLSVGARFLEQLGLDEVPKYTRVASYLLLAFGLLRLATSGAVWIARTRRGRVTPKILRDVVDAALYVVVLAVVLRVTLKIDVGSLLATSAVLSVVVGLALQETLGNLFAGLSLQAETPFVVGDWVAIGQDTGKVVQVTWRQTRIVTVRSEIVTIPNSVVAKEHINNYSGGEGIAHDLYLEVDYDSPPNAVKAACLEVLTSHPRVRKSPRPLFRVCKWETSGLQYQLRYFTDRFEDLDDLKDELLSRLWYRVRREGFSIPFPTRRVLLEQGSPAAGPASRPDVLQLLGRVDFLRTLGPEGLAQLAQLSALRLFGRDEQVVRQGETGATFFLVVSGEVEARASGATQETAHLGAGQSFGELALLTDEPFANTVVALVDSELLCVNRGALGELLRSHEGFAKEISDLLAARAAAAKEGGPAQAGLVHEASRILGRLRELFR